MMITMLIDTNQTDGSREWPFIPLDPFCVCSSKVIVRMMLIMMMIIVKMMIID